MQSRLEHINNYNHAPAGYANLLKEIKDPIQRSRTRAIFSVNAELIRLYRDKGRIIDDRQRHEGWGTAVIPRLARELRNELPEEKGYSERKIKRMLAFYRHFRDLTAIVPQPVAQSTGAPKVPQAVAQTGGPSERILWTIPWGRHALLMERVDLL
jgi:DUF1016 N-terminal domain